MCVRDEQQIQVQHPAAKSMIEISRTQDEEVGDGTTSVIILGKRDMRGIFIIQPARKTIILMTCVCEQLESFCL